VDCGVTPGQLLLHDRPSVAPPRPSALVADGVATGSASRASRLRSCAHFAVGAGAWLLLGVLWLWQVDAHHIPAHWLATVTAVVVGAAVFAAFCVVWVVWNRSIYRRRHNRRSPIIREVQFESDALGRLIVASEDDLLASHLVVDVDEATSRKYFLVA
jgi:hypothetical protein